VDWGRNVTFSHAVNWQSWVKLRHILILGFLLRAVWALVVDVSPMSDGFVYDQLAQRIASGHGYSWPSGEVTAYWPVGTSALYACVYLIFGHNMGVVAAVNVIMGTLLIAATYSLVRTQFERCIALLAAALVAVWPTWIAFTTIISSELPSTLAFTAALAVAFSGKGPAWLRTVISTVLIVVSTYIRANLLPFVLLVPALIALQKRSVKYLVAHGILAATITAVLIAPWALRNERAFGERVAISTNFGVNLWIGNNPQSHGGYDDPPAIGVDLEPLNEVEEDKLYRKHAISFIRENPSRYLALTLSRVVQTFDRETYGVGWNQNGLAKGATMPLKAIMAGYWLAIFAAALAGLALYLWQNPARILTAFVLIPGALVAPSILVMASERFHYGLAPFVAAFAAYAVVRLLPLVHRGQQSDQRGNGVRNG
jgi:4-amino-4-deoxy-L-arabinose transferase-like glycosyltransferase